VYVQDFARSAHGNQLSLTRVYYTYYITIYSNRNQNATDRYYGPKINQNNNTPYYIEEYLKKKEQLMGRKERINGL